MADQKRLDEQLYSAWIMEDLYYDIIALLSSTFINSNLHFALHRLAHVGYIKNSYHVSVKYCKYHGHSDFSQN